MGHGVHVPAVVSLKYRPAGHEMVPDMVTPVVELPPRMNCEETLAVVPVAKHTKAPLFIEVGAVNVYVVTTVVSAAVGLPDAAVAQATEGAVE